MALKQEENRNLGFRRTVHCIKCVCICAYTMVLKQSSATHTRVSLRTSAKIVVSNKPRLLLSTSFPFRYLKQFFHLRYTNSAVEKASLYRLGIAREILFWMIKNVRNNIQTKSIRNFKFLFRYNLNYNLKNNHPNIFPLKWNSHHFTAMIEIHELKVPICTEASRLVWTPGLSTGCGLKKSTQISNNFQILDVVSVTSICTFENVINAFCLQ
jgi:hypothetical protein